MSSIFRRANPAIQQLFEKADKACDKEGYETGT
jgi:hypothetical protein